MDKTNLNLHLMGADELAQMLEYHNRLYWEYNAPEIPDAQYDEIVRALERVAPDHPLLTQIHTPAVAGSGKVKHSTPMLSLDKAYSLEELLNWANKFARTPDEKLLIEPKYDGISASFNGKILATRGDGEFGEDISDKLPLIELEAPGYTGPLNRPARGELLIREDDFKERYPAIRKKDGGFYKNCRNAVAGIMGLKDISSMLVQHAKITLADYNLHQVELPLSQLADRWEELKEKMAALPYPQDGIVLKFADKEFRNSLGSTAHHPRGEIAYKFSNIRKTSTLRDVEWSSGKNCLTPVAIFDPVEISGTTITRATLHNVENLLALGVMIGDTITVERAGDVIPHIIESSPGTLRKDAMIRNCPKCGSAVIRSGPELVCPNPECPGTVLQLLAGAVRCFGIDNLGGATLEKLYSRGLVRHVRDLFDLTASDLLKIDGFASKSVSNLLKELEKAKNVHDYQLLAALNIPGIGLNIAKQILARYSISELRQMSPEQLATISGIGPERAAAIESELAGQSAYLDELLSAVNLIRSGEADTQGKTVCFTGKMPEKRSFYETLAEQHGYRAVSDVTRELSILVAADPAANGGKLDKARKYDVRIMALSNFLDLLEQEQITDVSQEEPEDSLFSGFNGEPVKPEIPAPQEETHIIQGELF